MPDKIKSVLFSSFKRSLLVTALLGILDKEQIFVSLFMNQC